MTTTTPSVRAQAGGLAAYRRKRDLSRSGEPAGSGRPQRRGGNAVGPDLPTFVIQKHDARRLHYDLRLEMEGVMRSWAVPKGLPARTGRKVLAIEVEDHPLDYAGFEGVIPPGHYGAGTVMVWDRGHYLTAEEDPAAAHRAGKLDFALVGAKCSGNWTLRRMRTQDGDKPQWLLIKRSEPTRRTVIKRDGRERSVATGRTMNEIAREAEGES